MSRADYWNHDYYEYWRKRTAEANDSAGKSALVSGDRTTVGDRLLDELLTTLTIHENHKVLDLGCGFGRIVPMLSRWTSEIYGSDISSAMISEAQKAYGNVVQELRVEEAERSSFPDEFFDRIVCWGVFDATDQAAALGEILRLLKHDGRVLLTGKNSRYESADAPALTAEENARRKAHPNHFTDYCSMRQQLVAKGAKVCEERFFVLRGDFSLNKFVSEIPPAFYEYLVVMERADYDGSSFSCFSSAQSATWMELRGQCEPRPTPLEAAR